MGKGVKIVQNIVTSFTDHPFSVRRLLNHKSQLQYAIGCNMQQDAICNRMQYAIGADRCRIPFRRTGNCDLNEFLRIYSNVLCVLNNTPPCGKKNKFIGKKKKCYFRIRLKESRMKLYFWSHKRNFRSLLLQMKFCQAPIKFGRPHKLSSKK